MNLDTKMVGTTLVVSGLPKHLDHSNATEFGKAIFPLVEKAASKTFIVDMSGVTYCSSAGMRILVMISNRMGELNGDWALVNLTEVVYECFTIARLIGHTYSRLVVFNSIEDALTVLAPDNLSCMVEKAQS